VPHPPRFRALAVFGRRPHQHVESTSCRRPKTCTSFRTPAASARREHVLPASENLHITCTSREVSIYILGLSSNDAPAPGERPHLSELASVDHLRSQGEAGDSLHARHPTGRSASSASVPCRSSRHLKDSVPNLSTLWFLGDGQQVVVRGIHPDTRRPRSSLLVRQLQLTAHKGEAFGSRAALATTLASRPVYPRQLPTCCIAQVDSTGPQADIGLAHPPCSDMLEIWWLALSRRLASACRSLPESGCIRQQRYKPAML
jgi:hypothetical protein